MVAGLGLYWSGLMSSGSKPIEQPESISVAAVDDKPRIEEAEVKSEVVSPAPTPETMSQSNVTSKTESQSEESNEVVDISREILTPNEENAAIPLLLVCIPASLEVEGTDPTEMEELCQQFGIELPVASESTFLSAKAYAEQQGVDFDIEERLVAHKSLWKTGDHPFIEQWLNRNQPTLAVCRKTLSRPYWEVPSFFVNNSARLHQVDAPLNVVWLQIASLLGTNAMLQAGNGNNPEAIDDCLQIYRLANHLRQGGSLEQVTHSFVVDHLASDCVLSLLTSQTLTTEDVKLLATRMEEVGSIPALLAMSIDGFKSESVNLFEAHWKRAKAGRESLLSSLGLAEHSDSALFPVLKRIESPEQLETYDLKATIQNTAELRDTYDHIAAATNPKDANRAFVDNIARRSHEIERQLITNSATADPAIVAAQVSAMKFGFRIRHAASLRGDALAKRKLVQTEVVAYLDGREN